MNHAAVQTPSAAWWQPDRAGAPAAASSGVAFAALVSFTAILLLSPQAWLPILGTLRIAFVVAVVAIGAHLVTQIIRAHDVAATPADRLRDTGRPRRDGDPRPPHVPKVESRGADRVDVEASDAADRVREGEAP